MAVGTVRTRRDRDAASSLRATATSRAALRRLPADDASINKGIRAAALHMAARSSASTPPSSHLGRLDRHRLRHPLCECAAGDRPWRSSANHRGWLGVRIQPVDDGIAETSASDRARRAGAGIDEHGPAKPAGLQAGDVIVKFDGHDIRNRAICRASSLLACRQGSACRYHAQGEELTKTVTLGRLEDGEKQMAKAETENAEPEAESTTPRRSAWRSRRSARNPQDLQLKDSIKGVVVTDRTQLGRGGKGLRAGDVIEEVNSRRWRSPATSPSRSTP